MSNWPETRAAWTRLKFNFRAMICEGSISFAYWICPMGWTPSPSQVLADEMRKATPEHRARFAADFGAPQSEENSA